MSTDPLRELAGHYGPANAIPRTELAARLGWNPRRLEQVIQRLRREGEPIGSSTGQTPGYYLVTDLAEYDRAIASLERRRNECSVTIAAMRKHRRRVGQTRMAA